jgi:hypothetical protein
MNTATLLWMIIFALSALCFFVVAAVVSVRGFADLRDLLRFTKRTGRSEEDARES